MRHTRSTIPMSLTGLLVLMAGTRSFAQSEATTPTSPSVIREGNAELHHPRLLARRQDYPLYRANAAEEPWSSVAATAIEFAESQAFDLNGDEFLMRTQMIDLCEALALAHVLAPRPEHVSKIEQTLSHWEEYYLASPPPGEGGVLVRWRQSAMVASILALDVFHDDLPVEARDAIVRRFDQMVMNWWDLLDQDGTTSTPGVVAVWALFKNDIRLAREAGALYLERIYSNLTPSGVFDAGPGYAWVRHASDRISKYMPLDILEHTGLYPDLFRENALRTLHEWMYGGSFTPRRTNLTFGDSDPSREVEGVFGYPQPYRARAISPLAGRNAAWVVRDVPPRPLLSNYVRLSRNLLLPKPPKSRIWGDATAFWEEGAQIDSLMGALWSPRDSSSHSHRDVNAVHLYAYGENILRNSGYCGSGVGIDAEFDWDWIRDQAAANNTITIDDANHVDRVGDGIFEGFTAGLLDYAAAGAGPALSSGEHTRSLVMIHGEPGRPGYFFLYDEVETEAPATPFQVNLHPDSAVATELIPNQEYAWSIREFGDENVSVSIYLATPPAATELRDGGLCAFDDRDYIGRYLRSTYVTDEQGRADVLTLVVPHDTDHPKPILIRIPGGSIVSGALVAYPGGALDVVLESQGNVPIPVAAGFVIARLCHVRLDSSGGIEHYFVRRGRHLDNGNPMSIGFQSDADVSLLVRGTRVHVTSQGANIVFRSPRLQGTTFSSEAGTVVNAGPGFLEMSLLPGTHEFDLIRGSLDPIQGETPPPPSGGTLDAR